VHESLSGGGGGGGGSKKVFILAKIEIKYLRNSNQDPGTWSYRVTPLTTMMLILVVYKRYLHIPAALLI